eukprot:gnl/MRDRNA2_/MRDRNA2_140550_c0_seq1.p1 gnl/MRDRNA2_/MRDRNA2_140550_c0~~gnl/MRDRNA2_/MRDRNA2_140550_c0_seq1.p1  ORF type:complete len:170 (-),score=27.78 gnl/MRDRNA2_/MRDRNA2_140550_c0_seq1:121-630(-)
MQEEVYGPVLPIMKVKSIQEAIDFVNKRDRPLALYVFSGNTDTVNKVLAETCSGGCCVNDIIYHIANPSLPFGGIGPSGCGHYHGKAGFEEFSHQRSVMWRPTWIDPKERYPPYSDKNVKFLMTLLLGFGYYSDGQGGIWGFLNRFSCPCRKRNQARDAVGLQEGLLPY